MSSLRLWWAQNFLQAEWLACMATGLASIVWLETFGGWPLIDGLLRANRSVIYGALSSIFGSLLGFIITAASIALSYSASDRLSIVRESKHYDKLWAVFTSAARWLALGAVIAFVALIADRDASPVRWLTYAVWTSSLVAAARVVRCIWVLENVVKIVTKPGT